MTLILHYTLVEGKYSDLSAYELVGDDRIVKLEEQPGSRVHMLGFFVEAIRRNKPTSVYVQCGEGAPRLVTPSTVKELIDGRDYTDFLI